MLIISAGGLACFALALFNFPFKNLDFHFLILATFTIGFGSRITIQIPRFKSYISVSDTFIFLAMLLYGGETAVVLAAVEAFASSWRFCNKKTTIFFNAATLALSTTIVVASLNILRPNSFSQFQPQNPLLNEFIISLLTLAFVQFIANTAITSFAVSLKNEKPLWETWKTKYLWTFFTYFIGAASAGILFYLTHLIGFSVILGTFPVVFLLYQTYKIYLQNVEMANAQAEQAEEYADALEKQSAALRDSEERFRSAFNYAPIGIALVSAEGKWLKVNRALCEILGFEEIEFLATDFQSMIYTEDLGTALIKIHELLSGTIRNCQIEQRYLHKSGKIIWTLWSVSAASDLTADRPNLIFQINNITDKKFAEEKLQRDATHDALTNLPNRACFMNKLEQALLKIQSNPNHKVSVLFIDLDRFKVVNDSLGHLVGDELLVGIAERLRDCMRPSDLVARLGGDEFTILVEGKHQSEEVVKIAERIQERLSAAFNLSGHEVYSSASIGILHAAEKHKMPEDMMRDADTAMYQAKREGRARHEVFDERMHKAVKETLQLETDLRRAIEKESLMVFYQPIYSLTNGEIQGFEALTRWEHETLGAIPPSKFIPLAEEVGLIDALGEQVLQKACRQIALLNESLTAKSPYILSINLSCKQFAQPNLVRKIKRILDENKFPPHLLKLEITESVFFEHKNNAIQMLQQLRELGIEINIDDFGTGYSNLSYLTQLPISTLKIDRSFISPLEGEGNNFEVVHTIIMLARSLGMKVIAEGVENEAQLEHLKKLNCEGAQGYFFARPMSFEDIKIFLSGNQIPVLPEKFGDVPVVSTIQ